MLETATDKKDTASLRLTADFSNKGGRPEATIMRSSVHETYYLPT